MPSHRKTHEARYRDLMRRRCREMTRRLAVTRALAEEGSRCSDPRTAPGCLMRQIGSALAEIERDMDGWFDYDIEE